MTTEVEKTPPIDLRAIRHASDLSIQDIADALGYMHRRKVTQMELRNDWLLSSVIKFINAAGGTATLTVNINGETLEFPLVDPLYGDQE